MNGQRTKTAVVIPFVRPVGKPLCADVLHHTLEWALSDLTCDPPLGSAPETYGEACARIDDVFAARMKKHGGSVEALATAESLKRQLKEGLQHSLGLTGL